MRHKALRRPRPQRFIQTNRLLLIFTGDQHALAVAPTFCGNVTHQLFDGAQAVDGVSLSRR
jgi:hypothetical protein